MSEERVLSHDPDTGILTWYHEDPDGTVTIRTEQDVSGLVAENLAFRNEAPRSAPWGDFNRVASLPLNVYWDLKRIGIVDDRKAFMAWLNCPWNSAFRTRDGVL